MVETKELYTKKKRKRYHTANHTKHIKYGAAFASPAPTATNAKHAFNFKDMQHNGESAHMVQQLHSHLDIGGLASNNHQPLAFPASGSRGTVHADAYSTRFHDLDVRSAHVANLVDFCASLSDDAPDQVVRDVDLLRLELLRRVLGMRRRGGRRRWWWIGRIGVAGVGVSVGVRISWNVRRAGVRGAPRVARRFVRCSVMSGCPLVGFNEDIANVVGRDMNCIGHSRDAKNTLICLREPKLHAHI